ncbi:MAG: MtaA/CmuA family methyltransferase [Acidobacteria bacterium]|nr:MtaA/CmuA family methyltransferase [Acidobacteriota bacterium]
MALNSRQRVLAALRREAVDRAPAINPTSVATLELMDRAGAAFPEAHRDPAAMARLAAAGHTELGFDSVMPVFSIVQESAVLGCRVEWGARNGWPAVKMREPIWRDPDEIRIPANLLTAPETACVLEAIRILKRQFGDEVAVLGKTMGPWTLAYHCFGLEPFLLMTVDDPGKVHQCLDRLKEVTVAFGRAQIDAGADALTLPDHATGDLVSGAYYTRFLRDLHREMAGRLPAPLILHICGRTLDRIEAIAQTGVAAFHFDSKNPPREAMRLAGGRMALAGSVNNPVTLLTKGPEEVRREALENLTAGVGLLAPECAVPLETRLENLRQIPLAARQKA